MIRRILAILVACAAAAAAHAGGPLFTCPGGVPAKFAGNSLVVRYDPGSLAGLPGASAATWVDQARTLWNDVSTSSISILRGPDLPLRSALVNYAAYTNDPDDGINAIIYDNDGSVIEMVAGPGASNWLPVHAVTYWTASPTCALKKSIGIVNGRLVTPGGYYPLTLSFAHLLGRMIGLDNSQVNAGEGATYSRVPIMYPRFEIAYGLHEDDIAGVTALYPESSASSAYGTLTGFFLTDTGAPIRGANIWAHNDTYGGYYSVVSDYGMQGTGFFKLLLPPGQYSLHAEPISQTFYQVFQVGPYARHAADISFQPPLYVGGVPMAPVTLSKPVHVVAGCATSVTFLLGGGGTTDENCVQPSEIYDPNPSSQLMGPATFRWTTGIGTVSERYLSIGTTPGGTEIYSGYQGQGLSYTLANVPYDGTTLYVRLMTYMAGVWRTRDYTYHTVNIAQPSVIVSPAVNATFPGSSVTFQWTSGTLVKSRSLGVSSKPNMTGTIYYPLTDQGSALSSTVTGLPVDGSTVWVQFKQVVGETTLTTRIEAYTYTAATPVGSVMVSPANGSTLGGSSAIFTWTLGGAVTERYLTVGSTVGGSDVYSGYQGAALSRTVTGIPTDGRTIYVRLASWLGSGWSNADYAFRASVSAPAPLPAKSNLTSPAPGSTLAGAGVTFVWDAGVNVAERYLAVGSTAGASDVYAGYQGGALSKTVSAIPTDGRTIYVSLSSWVGSGWLVSSATYTAYGAPSGPPIAPSKSNLTSPAPGSTLGGTSVTFTWDAGGSVSERYLAVGTTPGASDIYGGYQGAALVRTVTTMPTDGRTIYVSLSSWVSGGWQTSTATYTAASSGGGPAPSDPASVMTSPAAGSSLGSPGTSAATFDWTSGSGVTERYLMVGASSGGSQIYAAYQGAALSRTVSGIPCGTGTIYVRLMSYVGGSWLLHDYVYTSAGCALP